FITKNLCTNLILGMDYLLQYDLEIKRKKTILHNFNGHKMTIFLETDVAIIDCPVTLSNSMKITPNK
ncbi:unnamed protein product, partial [Rotaria sp. Silwood2]